MIRRACRAAPRLAGTELPVAVTLAAAHLTGPVPTSRRWRRRSPRYSARQAEPASRLELEVTEVWLLLHDGSTRRWRRLTQHPRPRGLGCRSTISAPAIRH
ncbi:MAG: hypothetical protein MZV49_01110 [Rhodopseudomonas palustris]|nr:hypothetical protein [Rhodopseudomonas palustris]